MTHEEIARICHEADGALQSAVDHDHLYWEQLEAADRKLIVRRVRLMIENPGLIIEGYSEARQALFKGIVEALMPFSNTKAKAA